MQRGYIRATKAYPRDVQWNALVEAGVDPGVIYIEGEVGRWKDLIKSLREAARDEIVVYTLQVVAGDVRGLRAAMKQARDKRAVVVEILQERRSDDAEQVADMIFDALSRPGLSSDEASRIAKLRKPRRKALNVTRREAIRIWRDRSITTNEEAAALIGLSVPTCFRRFKASGRPAGRRRT